MGSSVQNVHWCRCRVRFNRLPKKVVEKVPEKVQSQGRFNRVPETVEEGLGVFWWRFWRRFREGLVGSIRFQEGSVRFIGFRWRFRRWSGRLWCRARSGSTGFRRGLRRRSGEGLLWCRARSGSTRFRRRFGRLWCLGAEPGQVWRGSEKVSEKVPEKVWAALVQPGQVRQGSGESSSEGSGTLWCRARSGSTGFRRGLRRRSGEGLLWCRARSGSTRFRRRFGRLWCLGAEPGQVWRGSEKVPEKVPEKIWAALVQPGQVRQGSGGSRRKSWKVQIQVRVKRVLEKVPEKVPGSLGAQRSQVQRIPETVAEVKLVQVHWTHGHLAEVFPELGFAARFRQICDNQMLRLLGIDTTEVYFLREPTSTLAQKAIVRAEQSQQQDVERETPPKKRMAKASNKWNDPAEQDAEKKMPKKKESQKERERETCHLGPRAPSS